MTPSEFHGLGWKEQPALFLIALVAVLIGIVFVITGHWWAALPILAVLIFLIYAYFKKGKR